MSKTWLPAWEVQRDWNYPKAPASWSESQRYQPETSMAQIAAELWVEHNDSEGDYVCVGGSPMHVRVRPLLLNGATGKPHEWEEFIVTGESVPDYTGRAVNEIDHSVKP